MPSQLSYFSLSHALFNPPSYLHVSFLSFFLPINTPSFSFAFLYASLFKAFPLSFYSSSFPFLAYFLLLKTIPSCALNILWESTIMWLCVCVRLWKALKQSKTNDPSILNLHCTRKENSFVIASWIIKHERTVIDLIQISSNLRKKKHCEIRDSSWKCQTVEWSGDTMTGVLRISVYKTQMSQPLT